MNRVARVICVEEPRVYLADPSETVFHHPVAPIAAVFTMASLGPRPPDRVGQHNAKASDLGLNVGLSTDEVTEVAGGRGSKAQLVVNVGDRSKHRRAAAKDVSSGIVRMKTEATAKIGTMSTRISEHHVVGECNDVEPSIGRKPGGCPGVVAE